MALDPANLDDAVIAFLTEYHLATLTTLRADGSPHVVPVGFSWDGEVGLARVITFEASQKVANIDRALRAGGSGASRAAVSQVDRGRWLTLEGPAVTTRDPERVAAGIAGYAARYRQPSERDDRVIIEIAVDRVMGRA